MPARASAGTSGKAGAAGERQAVALCAALHELPGRRRGACCSEAPVSLYFDECVRLLSEAVRAGRVTIDDSKVATCAARVDEATRGCNWVAPTYGAAPAVCADAVSGLVAQGGRCTSSLECAGELHCAGQGATSAGVCRPPGKDGAGCGASVDSLATYLAVRGVDERKPQCAEFCALTSHRCEARPVEGATCRASANCAPDQTCHNGRCAACEPTEGATGRATGEACITDFDCALGGCVTGAEGQRTCAKKCSADLASLAGRGSLRSLAIGVHTESAARSATPNR